MDWSKYPLEKLVFFVAAVIPGFVVLLTYEFIRPGSVNWFFRPGFLGYKTEVALFIIVCFVVGFTVTMALQGLVGAAYGAYFNAKKPKPFKAPHSYPAAPWRDPRWRVALIKHLGPSAPSDTLPMTSELLEERKKFINSLVPPNDRPQRLLDLEVENFQYNQDDARWFQWYDHYHTLVLQPPERDLFYHVGWGLRINFESTAVFILISALVVPQYRHWWIIASAIFWISMFASEEYNALLRQKNQWSTLQQQIKYLSSTAPGAQKSLF
jgi:hypothetical protein